MSDFETFHSYCSYLIVYDVAIPVLSYLIYLYCDFYDNALRKTTSINISSNPNAESKKSLTNWLFIPSSFAHKNECQIER